MALLAPLDRRITPAGSFSSTGAWPEAALVPADHHRHAASLRGGAGGDDRHGSERDAPARRPAELGHLPRLAEGIVTASADKTPKGAWSERSGDRARWPPPGGHPPAQA